MSQVVETDLAVHGKEKLLIRGATDSHVDVTKATVHMDEHYVVVEDEQVHYEKAQMDDEGEEIPYKARICLTLRIVEVELEKVSCPILRSEINHADQEKVEDCRQAIPSYEFAEGNWETVYVLL
jgi:hypothetical protein